MLKGLCVIGVLAAMGLGLSGCHAWRSITHSCANEKDSYLKSTSVAPLRVPLGLDPPDAKSGLQIPALNEPPLPPRRAKEPCLDEPPKFIEPRGPRPAPAV